ncbi:MAG: NAD(P)H-dependent oxidoreductase [Verrucomicrobia bacterium]|nr:NAD(P)H-dependent oxidoreductase [Verrucomicrobiota bacterium]
MMKKLFHISACPRGEDSRTLRIAESFLRAFQESHPDWVFDELDLTREPLPSLSSRRVDGKYLLMDGKHLFGEMKESWTEIIQHVERFKSSDMYLISAPMWNFHIPYMLKHYIDLIVQPQYLFRYLKGGKTEGLVKGRKMVVATSRGGQYVEDPSFDFQTPYLKGIFNFIGIEDISFVIGQPMDMGEELRNQRLQEAIDEAARLGREI